MPSLLQDLDLRPQQLGSEALKPLVSEPSSGLWAQDFGFLQGFSV